MVHPGCGPPTPVYTSASVAMHGAGPPQGPHMMAGVGGMMGYYPRPQMVRSGGSPNSGGSPSPGSDDSDDSTPLAQVCNLPRFHLSFSLFLYLSLLSSLLSSSFALPLSPSHRKAKARLLSPSPPASSIPSTGHLARSLLSYCSAPLCRSTPHLYSPVPRPPSRLRCRERRRRRRDQVTTPRQLYDAISEPLPNFPVLLFLFLFLALPFWPNIPSFPPLDTDGGGGGRRSVYLRRGLRSHLSFRICLSALLLILPFSFVSLPFPSFPASRPHSPPSFFHVICRYVCYAEIAAYFGKCCLLPSP